MNTKEIYNREEIYLELALVINKNMYDNKQIPYHIYKKVEDKLLEKINYLKQKKGKKE